ncbi:MAG: alpha/beta hydrolase [Pseudomonadota bacterium]
MIVDEIRSNRVSTATGLTQFYLEAGPPDAPVLLLLHGFPELAFSWRKVMPPLARLGFRVVAPDQRGYGQTTGWVDGFDGDVESYRLVRLAGDAVAFLAAIGARDATAVIGHDFGSPVAHAAALMRPDVFRACVMMSAPVPSPQALPLGATRADASASARESDRESDRDVHADLATLPRPRKHYQWYYSTRDAAQEMLTPPEGLHAFLRAYYHVKSADWADNRPEPLARWSAEALARLPTYYVMDLADTMPEAVAPHAPSPDEVRAATWLTDDELAVYVERFQARGFQAPLNWYRCQTEGRNAADLRLWAGQRLAVPTAFIAGASDWGIHQVPGALAAMETSGSTDYRGTTLVPGAGHWVQQERPDEVVAALTAFLQSLA